MKKLILIVGLILGQFCFSQDSTSCKINRLSMDNEIVPYVEEFIKDAKDRGFYVKSFLIERIDYMHFSDTLGVRKTDNRLGQVGEDFRGFYLSPTLKGNPVKLRLTIYHEIGHVIKQSAYHSCGYCYDIMSGIAPIDLKPYLNDTFWALKVDEYFQWLNRKE